MDLVKLKKEFAQALRALDERRIFVVGRELDSAIEARDRALKAAEALHAAVCQAVVASNDVELVRTEAGRKMRDILRQALVDYADAVQPPQAGGTPT